MLELLNLRQVMKDETVIYTESSEGGSEHSSDSACTQAIVNTTLVHQAVHGISFRFHCMEMSIMDNSFQSHASLEQHEG